MRFEHHPQSSPGRSVHSRRYLGIDWLVESFHRALAITDSILQQRIGSLPTSTSNSLRYVLPIEGAVEFKSLLVVSGGLIIKPQLLVT